MYNRVFHLTVSELWIYPHWKRSHKKICNEVLFASKIAWLTRKLVLRLSLVLARERRSASTGSLPAVVGDRHLLVVP
jgi:hypothetical protein